MTAAHIAGNLAVVFHYSGLARFDAAAVVVFHHVAFNFEEVPDVFCEAPVVVDIARLDVMSISPNLSRPCYP